MRAVAACAHYHIIAIADFVQQMPDVLGAVLAIRVHKHEEVSFRSSGPRLDGGAVTLAVRVFDYGHALLCAYLGCRIGRTVVHHNDFAVRPMRDDIGQQALQVIRFVFGGQNDAQASVGTERRLFHAGVQGVVIVRLNCSAWCDFRPSRNADRRRAAGRH